VPTGRARRDNELGAPPATGAAATSQHRSIPSSNMSWKIRRRSGEQADEAAPAAPDGMVQLQPQLLLFPLL